MKHLATALIVTASLGTASAQFVASELSTGWVGDENIATPAGSLPYCYDRDGVWSVGPIGGGSNADDPSCTWATDNNGLTAALGGTRTTIINVEWRSDVGAYAGLSQLLGRFDQDTGPIETKDILVPGLGQFWIWHGSFDDLNGDGWISDNLDSQRVKVALRQDCDTTPSTTDPNGLGTPQGVPPPFNGVSARCIQPEGDEWVGDNSATIPVYVTPGDYDGTFPSCCVGQDMSMPDCYARASYDEGGSTGQYSCPTSDLDHTNIDSGFLETTVVEAFDAPTVGGSRSAERTGASIADVDLFTSVNPTIEELYQEIIVQSALDVGCDVDAITLLKACPVLQQRLLPVEGLDVTAPDTECGFMKYNCGAAELRLTKDGDCFQSGSTWTCSFTASGTGSGIGWINPGEVDVEISGACSDTRSKTWLVGGDTAAPECDYTSNIAAARCGDTSVTLTATFSGTNAPGKLVRSATTSRECNPIKLVFYKELNWGGTTRYIAQNVDSDITDDRFDDGTDLNDAITSFRLRPGCSLILYEHVNFGGASRSYTGDWSHIGMASDGTTSLDNKASSYILTGC